METIKMKEMQPREAGRGADCRKPVRPLASLVAVAALCLLSCAGSAVAQTGRTAKPTVSILGDSYSTFAGHIPAGNETWYDTHPKKGRTDVSDVKQTWWWQVVTQGGFVLGVNDSYSGATISYAGYNGDDYRDRSFITRLKNLGSPDVILIFGGTNDSWAGVETGEWRWEPDSLEELAQGATRGGTQGGPAELYRFRPALCRLLGEAIDRYPGTDIYFILNTELREEISGSVKEACAHYGIPCIELHDIDKEAGHPSVAGMKSIAGQVLDAIRKE